MRPPPVWTAGSSPASARSRMAWASWKLDRRRRLPASVPESSTVRSSKKPSSTVMGPVPSAPVSTTVSTVPSGRTSSSFCTAMVWPGRGKPVTRA